MSTEALTRDLSRLRTNLAELERLLPIAWEIQWDKAPGLPQASDDTSERTKGGPVDNPTADIVLDGRRLAVRAAVSRAHALIRGATRASGIFRRGLEDAIAAWEGSSDE